MKIVCDSCGAKYSIADEKVAGKVFKIRCKKCSNTIVVRGDTQEHDDEEATRVFDHGAEAAWHVVVDGQQQGPYAPVQIAGLLNMARIDWEAYVWKEGFDGWLPLRQVDELVQAIGGEGPPASDGAESGEAASEDESPKSEAAPAEEDPFAASAGGEFAGAPEPAAEAPSQDLFGASAAEADPFGGAAAASPFGESGSDVVSSPAPAAGPKVSESQSMTGARNENSVLFSLSNLQALATPGSPSTPSASSVSRPASQAAGAASGDASGLIDIRALASANAAVGAGGSKKESAEGAVDDLLSVGTGASFGGASAFSGSSALGGGSSILGGPVEEPAVATPPAPAPKSSKVMPILGTVAVLGLGAAVVFLMMREPQQVVIKETIEVPAPSAEPAAAAPVAAAPSEEKAPEPAAAADPAPKPAEAAPKAPSTSRSSSSSRTSSSSSMTTAMTTTTTPSTTSSMTSTSMSSASKDIGSLLDRAVAPSASTMSTGGSANLPDTPSRDAVAKALGGVSATARACGNGTSGTARASVTFSGSTGRVSSVSVSGVPDAVGKCVERAVRNAKVSQFKQSSFNVTYPYRVQ